MSSLNLSSLNLKTTWLDLTCTDSMWQIESRPNSAWQCTRVCKAERRIICLSYACRSLSWLNDNISVRPSATYSSCQGSRRTRMVVVPSLWLGWWHENCSAMIFAILIWALTASDALSRRFCSNNIPRIQRIRGTVRLCAVQIDTYITYITDKMQTANWTTYLEQLTCQSARQGSQLHTIFRRQLKTFMFQMDCSVSWLLGLLRLINTLTYLFTCLLTYLLACLHADNLLACSQ